MSLDLESWSSSRLLGLLAGETQTTAALPGATVFLVSSDKLRRGSGGFLWNVSFRKPFPQNDAGITPGHTLRPTLIPLGAGPFPQMFSLLLATHGPQLGNSVAALHQLEALPLSPQTVATLSVLGTRRVVSILGVESQAVSLAACHLLQVIFDALKEGVKKGFRGKEGAIIVGEWKQVCGPPGVAVMEGKGPGQPGQVFGGHACRRRLWRNMAQ